MTDQGISLVSICAGVGVGCHGFTKRGWKLVCAIERDVRRRSILARHYPDATLIADLYTVRGADIPRADVWFVTLPCQAFSGAGSRGPKGSRRRTGLRDADKGGNLWWQFLRLLKEARKAGTAPQFVAFENVRGLLSANGGADWRTIQNTARANGLVALLGDVIDAQWVGSCQHRERVILVWRVTA